MVKPQATSDVLMELQQELAVVKEQLVASEAGKAEALREFGNMKSLLNELLLVEHFAAVDDELAQPVPATLRSDHGFRGQTEADNNILHRLRNDLQASAAELERAKQEITWLKADLDTARDLTAKLQDEVRKLQGDCRKVQQETTSSMEVSQAQEEMISASAIIQNNNALQADLQYPQRLHKTRELQNAKQLQVIAALHADFQTTLPETEIHKLPGELTAQGRQSCTTLRVTEEVKTKLEVVMGQYYSTCTELTGKIEKFGGQCEALQVKYESSFHLANQEEILKLQAEVAALKDERMMKTTALDAFHTELRKSEATVIVLQAEIGDLKAQLRDSVSTKSQLQKVRIELAIVKEVLDCISGDLSEELEAIRLQLPYCLTSLPHFVGSWMKQFERDCWIKVAVEKMKALEVELKSLCWKQAATQTCQVNSNEPESSSNSDEEVLETYFAELHVEKKRYTRRTAHPVRSPAFGRPLGSLSTSRI